MDAIPTDATDSAYSNHPPVLLAASSDAAMARAQRTIEASGRRVGARMPIELAKRRLGEQIATSAIWIEIDTDCGGPMDELLTQVSRDVSAGLYSAVVSATPGLIDPVAARVDSSAVELIVDADDAERAAALAIVAANHASPLGVSDIATDNNAERLRQLSEEVSRIASTLARPGYAFARARAGTGSRYPAALR